MQMICSSFPNPPCLAPCEACSQLEERRFFLGFPSLLRNPRTGERGDRVRKIPLLGLGRGLFHLGSGSQGLTCFLGRGEGRSDSRGCEISPVASSWNGRASATGHLAVFESQRGKKKERNLRDKKAWRELIPSSCRFSRPHHPYTHPGLRRLHNSLLTAAGKGYRL